MCRKEVTELEDIGVVADSDDDEDYEDEDEEDYDEGGWIRIPRECLDTLMRSQNSQGVTEGVEEELEISEGGIVDICRAELERILAEQGGNAFTDLQWGQVVTVFPPPLGALQVVGLENLAAFVEAPKVTLSRAAIQALLVRMGSSATATEFFNEEDGDEETLVVIMTEEGLNARLTSLGAMALNAAEFASLGRETLQITAFEDGSRHVAKKRVILNPEEDDELGPA